MSQAVVGCAKAAADAVTLQLDTATTDIAQCQFLVMTPDPSVQYAVLGVNSQSITASFMFGFAAVQGFFILGLVIKAGHDAIKRM